MNNNMIDNGISFSVEFQAVRLEVGELTNIWSTKPTDDNGLTSPPATNNHPFEPFSLYLGTPEFVSISFE